MIQTLLDVGAWLFTALQQWFMGLLKWLFNPTQLFSAGVGVMNWFYGFITTIAGMDPQMRQSPPWGTASVVPKLFDIFCWVISPVVPVTLFRFLIAAVMLTYCCCLVLRGILYIWGFVWVTGK